MSDEVEYVPSADDVIELTEALGEFVKSDSCGASTICMREDMVLPSFLRLADAAEDLCPLLSKMQGWDGGTQRRLRAVPEELDVVARAWGWQSVAAPEPHRSEFLARREKRWQEKFERPVLRAALTMRVLARDSACPREIDVAADEAEKLGLRTIPGIDHSEARRRYDEAVDHRNKTPKLGPCSPRLSAESYGRLAQAYNFLIGVVAPFRRRADDDAHRTNQTEAVEAGARPYYRDLRGRRIPFDPNHVMARWWKLESPVTNCGGRKDGPFFVPLVLEPKRFTAITGFPTDAFDGLLVQLNNGCWLHQEPVQHARDFEKRLQFLEVEQDRATDVLEQYNLPIPDDLLADAEVDAGSPSIGDESASEGEAGSNQPQRSEREGRRSPLPTERREAQWPGAGDQDVPVLIVGKPSENPRIRGKEQERLTLAQHEVVTVLLDAGDKGLSGDELMEKSHHTDAVKILKRVWSRNEDWKSIIRLAGRSGARYSISSR